MPKIFRNGVLNVFELFFFLDHINIYVNIGIADTFLNKNWNVKNVFIFVIISLYSLSMGNYVKIILTL